MNRRSLSLLLLAAAAIVACGGSDSPPADVDTAPATETRSTSVYADALAVEARLPSDFERDAARKPDEVLAFFGIEPGMVVLDMFSGGGYYSELIAHVVGASGHVDAHSNEAYLGFVGDEFDARHANGRLPNVSILMAENNELDLEADRYDAIVMVLSYHDLYYDDPDRGWPGFDVPRLLAELYEGLRPGGTLGIVDHRAEPGSPPETGNTLHRIDDAIVIEELTAAGFELAAESDVLADADDNHMKNVFDPDIRGKTDRFILRFEKPE
jgi:predicted methyltransferase